MTPPYCAGLPARRRRSAPRFGRLGRLGAHLLRMGFSLTAAHKTILRRLCRASATALRVVRRQDVSHRVRRATLVSRNSSRDNSCRSSQAARSATAPAVAGAAHIEGVFGEPADIAFHDHQVLRSVAGGPGVSARSPIQMVHPDMRRFRHVTRLAGQQQEPHMTRNRPRAPRWRVRPARSGSGHWCRRWSRAELAPAPSELDGVVDGAAAGIQHNGDAGELASAREFVELFWAICGDDADGADPAPAIRLQATQLNFIGCLRSSRVTPACARSPLPAMMAGNAMQRATAQSAQPPNWSDFTSLNLVPSPKCPLQDGER